MIFSQLFKKHLGKMALSSPMVGTGAGMLIGFFTHLPRAIPTGATLGLIIGLTAGAGFGLLKCKMWHDKNHAQ